MLAEHGGGRTWNLLWFPELVPLDNEVPTLLSVG